MEATLCHGRSVEYKTSVSVFHSDASAFTVRLKSEFYFMTEEFTLKHLNVLRKQAIIFTVQWKQKAEYLPVSHKKGEFNARSPANIWYSSLSGNKNLCFGCLLQSYCTKSTCQQLPPCCVRRKPHRAALIIEAHQRPLDGISSFCFQHMCSIDQTNNFVIKCATHTSDYSWKFRRHEQRVF